MSLTPLIAGNWKMHKTVAETEAFFAEFLSDSDRLPEGIDIAVAPPFTSLQVAHRLTKGTRIALGAQNVHWEAKGAFTGEISPQMLVELRVHYVIVGHSERRQYFGETDTTVNKRACAAITHKLKPIICVGETLEQRDAGQAYDVVAAQTRAALADFPVNLRADDFVIAYEPVWAIGTGRNCNPEEADATMRVIRDAVPGLKQTRILYGGSVKTENIALYMEQSHINGALVGGASLDPHVFLELIRAAAI